MRDRFNKLNNAKTSLLGLCLIPVINLILSKPISIIIISLFTLLIIIGSVIRFSFKKKSIGVYILYISEFVGTLIFYCLHTIVHNNIIQPNEVNVVFNFLSAIFIMPFIFELAKYETKM